MQKTLLEVILVKRSSTKNRRYIYDALYGIIYLPDFIWKVIPCTELQHLREVRLCDINSLCLTGGANISRYEHAIGTCYLSYECIKNWPQRKPLSKEEQKQLLLAALLHDVVNPAFGHSVEHVVFKEGFRHENSFEILLFGRKEGLYKYKSVTLEPIYFGSYLELTSKVSEETLRGVAKIIRGEGKLGPLINGRMGMDLDNIDNVFRLAYHIGIVNSGKVPLSLAKSLWVEEGSLVVKEEAVPLVKEWYNVRRKLYSFLLLNPEEFSGKCMLREAIELAKKKDKYAFNWYDTDFELLKKLYGMPLVRQEVRNYLFSLKDEFAEEFKNHVLSERLLMIFEKNGHKLSNKAYIKTTKNGWKVYDGTKIYFVKHRERELRVYKLLERGIEIQKIVRRLMKGELYGCIGIFSSPNVTKSEIFTDTNKRRELEDELSKHIRDKYAHSRFKFAIIALHPIIDLGKTQRQVKFKTDRGRILRIGKHSRRLLIGVFFTNPNLNIYKINPISSVMKKIREDVRRYISKYLGGAELKEVELHAEAWQDE